MPDDNNQQEGEFQERENQEKQPGLLENIVDELSSFGNWIKKGAAIGAIAAMPYTFGLFNPAHIPGAQIMSYTMTSGRVTKNIMQKKPALDGVVKESMITSTMSYPFAGAFEGLNTLETKVTQNYGVVAGKLAKGAAWVGVGQPAATSVYTALRHGVGKKFREEVGGRIKTTWKYLGFPAALNLMFIAPHSVTAALGVSAALSYVFGFLQSGYGEEKPSLKNLANALNPIPYVSATASLGRKCARGTYDVGRGLFEAAYSIGKGIADTITKKPAAPQTPQPSPA